MKINFNLRSRASAPAGFTIIELLVAVAVTALMVSLMLTIVVNVLGGWNRSSGTLSSGNQARTVMDLITTDLQSAILRRDGNVWLVATIQNTASDWSGDNPTKKPLATAPSPANSRSIPAFPTTLTDPLSAIEDYRFGQGGVWLRFFSTVPDTNLTTSTISAPRAVAYRIIRQSVTGSGKESRYMFYRSELAPDTTFTTGYNLFGADYYTGVIKIPNRDSLIANNVVDFGVRFLKPNGLKQLIPIFPNSNDVSFAATSDITKVGQGVDASPAPIRDFPTVADIFVRILTDEGATQIANFEAGLITRPTDINSDDEYWWSLVIANSRVYTRRVEIKANSL
jgi:prepilin-type N-terminal cleavage/methylation domain-containing protein